LALEKVMEVNGEPRSGGKASRRLLLDDHVQVGIKRRKP
jgi:hypothetical protein